MNKYEVLYILAPGLEEAEYTANVDKFSKLVTDNGGEAEVDKWGLKRLAYPINFKNDGYYVQMNFTANPEFPAELERQMRITDAVMRFMVTKA